MSLGLSEWIVPTNGAVSHIEVVTVSRELTREPPARVVFCDTLSIDRSKRLISVKSPVHDRPLLRNARA